MCRDESVSVNMKEAGLGGLNRVSSGAEQDHRGHSHINQSVLCPKQNLC